MQNQQSTVLPAIETTRSITSTIQKVIHNKAAASEHLFCDESVASSTNAVHPAAMSNNAKPPMSSSKRS